MGANTPACRLHINCCIILLTAQPRRHTSRPAPGPDHLLISYSSPNFLYCLHENATFVFYYPNRCESRRNFWTAEATMDPSFLVFLGPKINKFSCSLVGNFLKFVFKMSDRVWKSTFLEDWWLGHSRRKCLLSSRLWPQLQAGDVVLPMANLWAFRVDAWSLSFVWRVLPSLDP